MAYHAPSGSQPFTDSSGIDHPPPPPSEDSTQESGSELQFASTVSSNRRRSSTKMPGLKRAFSSPSMRSLTTEEGRALSPLDKKKNKLGYHRTAVACGHCRRRKIRCIPASDETESRCQNCIRLKKECQFFPVDQQSTSPGRRPRAGTKTDSQVSEAEDPAAALSPRGVLSSSTLEQINSVNGQINTPPLTDDGSGFAPLSGSGSAGPHHDLGQPHEYEYRHGYPAPSHQPYHATNHEQYSHGENRGHFNPALDQHFASYGPYTSPPLSAGMRTSPQTNTGQFPQQSPRSFERGWTPHVPARAMSVADTNDLHNMYSMQQPVRGPMMPRRIGSGTSVPQLAQSQHMMMANDPREAGFVPHYHSNPYDQTPLPSSLAWSSNVPAQMGHVPVSGGDNYHPNWFANPNNLPFVREDPAQNSQPSIPGQQQFRPNPG